MIHASVKLLHGFPDELQERINAFFGNVEEECELIDIKYTYNNDDGFGTALIIYRLIQE